MTAVLGPFLPYLVILVVVGLFASLGPAWWVRRPAFRDRLLATSGRALGVWAVLTVVIALAATFWLVRPFLASGGSTLPGALEFALIAAFIGLPLSLPATVFAWKDARSREATRAQRRASTKEDRRAYAADLLEQIQDASPERRSLSASVGGEGGSVLRFEGDLSAKEGERLARALRDDLRDMGFKRVEGTAGAKGWWTRVPAPTDDGTHGAGTRGS